MAKTLWIDTLLDEQVASGGLDLTSLMTGVTEIDTRMAGLTLLRTIIGLHVAHLIHDSGEGSQRVNLGIGVASQPAFALGTSGVPDPSANGAAGPPRGWVWRASYVTYGFAADQAAVFDNRVDRDIRSRRKLDNGECYMIISNAADQGSTGTIAVIGLVRQLWLLT